MRPLFSQIFFFFLVKTTEASFEWQGAAETGREYAIGDPPPRPPRLPPNSTCTFGPHTNVPCSTAHNYFHDFDPIEESNGQLVFWNDDACNSRNDDNDANELFVFILENGETINQTDKLLGMSMKKENAQDIIVFVNRGGCSFADKVTSIITSVENLFLTGECHVVAVVLVDMESSVALLPPGLGEARNIHIPVVMITYESASELFNNTITPLSVERTKKKKTKTTITNKGRTNLMTGKVVLISASMDSLRGKQSCQCAVESPQVMKEFHFMHREGWKMKLKERLDFIVDEGKRALMSFSPVRTLKTMQYYAPQIPVHATIGVSQALLDEFVEEVLPLFPGPIILVTTDYNSDRSAPKPFETDHSWLLNAPHLVSHWFSDNWASFTQSDKLTLIPIGINDRHVVNSHGDRKLLLKAINSMTKNSARPSVAMANFHHSEKLGWWNNPASGVCCDRREAWFALNGSISLLSETCNNYKNKNEAEQINLSCPVDAPVKFLDYNDPNHTWWQHSNFAFEVCPHGNGVDTHRTWEALMLKTIPIVKTSSLDPLYEELPVVIVSNWNELIGAKGSENLAAWHLKLAPVFEESHTKDILYHHLTVEYWIELIRQKQTDLRDRIKRPSSH